MIPLQVKKIRIRKISIDSETAVFDCGNPSIEERIKHSYHASLLQEGYGYEVVADERLVGYYMIALTVLNGKNIPAEEEGYSGVFQCQRYAAVEITYLAIDKRYQKQKIGTGVLKAIIKSVRSWCGSIPIRYIMIDALKEKEKWYADRGFFTVNNSSADAGNSATVKMLIDCLCHEKELRQYMESYV